MNEIDFVIPWVDGSDTEWIAEKNRYQQGGDQHELSDSARYREWGTLKYWFRGVEKFAPWVRKIHFVTWGHVPDWLNTDHPKINIVRHEDYIPHEYLPTFSSHTIELNMHRIPGLADQFVYFNDDFFLCKPTKPRDFFKRGLPRDCAALNVRCYSLDAPIHMIMVQDTGVINAHFDFPESLLKHGWKWFTPLNRLKLLRTLVLLGCPRYPGFYEPHTALSYKKSTLEEVWNAEPELLDETCKNKFRDKTDVNQWVFRDWQLASGAFVPRSTAFSTRFFFEGDRDRVEVAKDAAACIKKQRHSIVCVNDYAMSESEFSEVKKIVIEAFETILPERCSYEMESEHVG